MMRRYRAPFLVTTLVALGSCYDLGVATRLTPYDEIDATFVNPKDGVRLAGTLTLPTRPGPHPGVVLVAGSGPHTRDLPIGEHRPFKALAASLGSSGVAVLRYDKRGSGQSGGTYEPYDLDTFAEDALAGHAFLAEQRMVDRERVGALGLSQGGLVVPRMAARSSDIAFVVLMAAPGIWDKEFFTLSNIAIARASGLGADEFARIRELYDRLWPLWTQPTLSEPETEQALLLLEQLVEFVGPESRALLGLDEPEAFFAFMRSPHFLESLKVDPRQVLRRLRCPVLAITGSNDVQVSAPENLEAIRMALAEGGHSAYEVSELEGLNHMFQHCRTGLPDEYLSSEEEIAPEVLTLVANWVRAVAVDDREM